MQFSPNIERYRPLVVELISDTLTDLVLAIIDNESGGIAGISADVETAHSANLPTDNGGFVTVKVALGLMQVIPINIVSWNQTHKRQITYNDMVGKDMASAAAQIQLGIYVLEHSISNVLNFIDGKINENSIKLALLAYAYGFGRLRNKLTVLQNEGLDMTFENMESNFPTWGQPGNRPFYFADKIYSRSTGTSINTKKIIDSTHTAGAIVLIASLLYFWWRA